MSEAVLDVAALDASASAVEAEIPALDAMPDAETPVVPAVESDSAADNNKTETTAEKPADTAKALTDAVAAFTPKAIVEKLSEIKKTDPALATRLHQEVKNSLEARKFLHDTGAKDFAEAKTLLSKPDEATEQFRQSIEAIDEKLYRGDLNELSNNILEDITAELGDAAPARLSELSEALLEKITEADPAGATRIQRAQFLAASETSGLIKSLNSLHSLLAEGKVAECQNVLKSIGKFFSEELKANDEIAKTRTEAKAAAERETTVTVTKLRAESEASVDQKMNVILGGFLSPFLKNALKGTSRPELESLASQIKVEAKSALGKNAAYVAEFSQLYKEMKTPAQKDKLMQKFEQALKKEDFGKKLVERVCKERFPEKFKSPAPKSTAPTSTQVTIGGKSQTVFQLAKRPTNLVRSDVEVAGRLYTSKDLELLQTAKGIGLVTNKSGKGHSFVQWKR
jgi:hypothetical protein